ncbi:serum response factor-binding protein 1 [Tachyglossus aculeatus]|uniref:serum response factor-binding protein 1 n=1 Tax=Tachyglossus aculeatus TaxID=9261 RepID=UPI0018F649A9|nr:serum response factor-binding protein 1 [Tachyglossus aculeatus]
MAEMATLNLNDEVVKMRKEVKKVRVLVIRKLTRHITKLKSKNGSEGELQKNERRVQRLVEEIHAMKEVKPDEVTKSALAEDINFEKVCKKPDLTATERAIARLATHPQLKKKTDDLKAAVKAFKDARQGGAGAEASEKCAEGDPSKVKELLSSKKKVERQLPKERTNLKQEEKDKALVSKKPNIMPERKVSRETSTQPRQDQDIPKSLGQSAPKLPSFPRETTKSFGQGTNTNTHATPNRLASTEGPRSDSSDLEELSEGEKEHFDDSTEERFYKQSSVSEDSGSEDDFFIGKVKRMKKKESSNEALAKGQKTLPKPLPKGGKPQEWENLLQRAAPEAGRSSGKSKKLESVFCHSLSDSKGANKNAREQAPRTRIPAFQQKESWNKKQLNKGTNSRPENKRQQQQQPLHPSWEASRKRKQEMSKITPFQGKKITFDDD